MIVASLVLMAFLLSIIALVVSFVRRPRVPASDVKGIFSAAQLDAALDMQRKRRLEELQRRATDRNPWPYALLGLALLMQIAAIAADHLAHPAIAGISILPAFCIVLAVRASQRRYAQSQLDNQRDSDSA